MLETDRLILREALFHSRLRVLEDWYLSRNWKKWKQQIGVITSLCT